MDDEAPLLQPETQPQEKRSSRSRILNVIVLASTMFLFTTAVQMQAGSLSEFFLHKQCVQLGFQSCNTVKLNTSSPNSGSSKLLGPSHSPLCFNDSKHATDNSGNDREQLQENAAAFLSKWLLVSNLCSFLMCPLVGAIGDAYGRRTAMCFPVIGFLVQNLALALVPSTTPDWLYIILTAVVTAIGGGIYAYLQVAFASVADLLAHASAKEKARGFAMVESSLWVGLTVGPFVIGTLIDPIGFPLVMLVISCIFAVTLILLCVYRETNEAAKRRSCSGRWAAMNWSVAHPLGGVILVATSKSLTPRNRRKLILLSFSGFFALICASGPFLILSFYAILLFDTSPKQIGFFQAAYFGSCAICLFFILPLMMRCFRLDRILQFSIAWTALSWALPSLIRSEWEFYLVSILFFFNSLYFPIQRACTASFFPKAQYGTALAIVGTLQQLTATIAPSLCTFVWAHLDAPFTSRSAAASCQADGTLAFRWDAPFGLTFLLSSAMGVVGLVLALCIGKLEEESHSDPDKKELSAP